METSSDWRPCVISLGINGPMPIEHPSATFQDFPRGLARVRETLARHGYRGDVITWDREYPAGSPINQQAYCAFKPFCFEEARRRGFEVVLWVDSSIVVKRSIDPVLRDIARDGYLLYENTHSVGEYCKDDALDTLGITREESFAMPSCSACVLGLDLRRPRGAAFLDQWQMYASDGVTFPGPKWSGVRGWPRVASRDPRVKGHRHDQTAASVIALRLGMDRWRSRQEFSWFFANDRTFVRRFAGRV